MRIIKLALLLVAASLILGCPIPVVSDHPSRGRIKHAEPKPVPRGQIQRQRTPSGPKPIPPGQRKRMAPEPAPAVVIAPPLPSTIVIEIGVPYYYEGFYYYYDNGSWSYSEQKGGKRLRLPKSHRPKVVKFKKGHGKDNGKGKGHRK